MTKSLGQLSNVEVRSLWPNEAADFTPWLARDENIWMVTMTERFHKTFGPRVKNLDLTRPVETDDSEFEDGR